MKKVLITIFVSICSFTALMAQEEGLTWGMEKASVEKIDAQLKDSVKASKSSTWLEKGRIYSNLFEFDVKNLFYGMKESDVTLVKGGGELKRRKEGDYTIVSYDRVDFYIKSGKLEKWVYTDDVRSSRPEPIYEVYSAYMKSMALEPRKLEKKLKDKLEKVKDGNHLFSVALFYYSSNDFATCLKYFEAIQTINDLPFINVTDTAVLTNCGVIAMKAKNTEKAKKYFTMAANKNIGGVGLYMDITKIYKESGDTLGAIETLKQGINKYPKDANTMIAEMVNIYLASHKTKEAMEYLTKAIELQPTNATYYFAIGTLYDQTKQQDKAISSYQKATELDPNYVDAYLNAGASYYNSGIEHFKTANDTKDDKKYDSEKKIALDYYTKSIPYLEKVKELTKDKKEKADALITLKQIYYKLGQTDKMNQAKAEYDALTK